MHAKSITTLIAFSLCLLLLALSFFAGWFELIKNHVKETTDKKNIFLEGIGKNIIPVAIGAMIYFIAAYCLIYLVNIIISHFFAEPAEIIKALTASMSVSNDISQYAQNLSEQQQMGLKVWRWSMFSLNAIMHYMFLFYMPALIEDSKNNIFLKPLSALLKAIKFNFKNFIPTFSIFAIIGIVNIFLGVFLMLTFANKILALLSFFLYIYFSIIIVMIIFNYYEQQNNCIDRCDCIREDESCNKTCEENQGPDNYHIPAELYIQFQAILPVPLQAFHIPHENTLSTLHY